MGKSIFQRDSAESEAQSAMTIAFVHHKGGTGKTTSCLNIAGWLVKMGKKVLVVDLDPQGNATTGLGIDRTTCEDSIYEVLFEQKDIEEIILETESGIYLAPSSIDLLAAEIHLAGQVNNIIILKQKLATMKESFDYILTDVSPGLNFLTISGIVASENIIIPLDSGIFGYETMATLKQLILDLHEELGVETNVMMVLLRAYSTSFFDKVPTNEVRKLLKGFLSENLTSSVRIWTIPFSKKVYRSQMKGMPISHYAPYSNVGRAYRKVTKEILKEEE